MSALDVALLASSTGHDIEATAASDTSAPPDPELAAEPAGPVDDDAIYQRMLSEMMGDPHDLVKSSNLDWRSVWDFGWSAAAEAEDKPIESRTEFRAPGADARSPAGARPRHRSGT